MLCPICRNDVATCESHHIIPREYGGEDLDHLARLGYDRPQLVNLCGACHTGCHTEAERRLSGKTFNWKPVFAGDTAERAEPFIDMIVISALFWEQRNPGTTAANKRQLVSFRVDASTLVKLHKLKADKGFSNLAKFMEAVVNNLTRRL